jgi:ubiquinone/menaquinone biosynthesis C-methylase UbiE
MTVNIINPKNKQKLTNFGSYLKDADGNIFPIIKSVPRIGKLENYTNNFGVQWNKFDLTQLDRESEGLDLSRRRFFAETLWDQEDLTGMNILEVGSGAGRFSKVLLEHTKGMIYSVDYSDAVTANYKNNGKIDPDRFHLFQASVYELPFPDNVFDKVFCFGVLQHTPDFQASVKALIKKVRPGGEIVIDFYPINGWWTKVHAKYIFRPLTRGMNYEKLFTIIEKNIDWLIKFSRLLNKVGLSILTRFLPLVDIRTMPQKGLNEEQFREWVILDTFDMFSPEHDNPQRISDVSSMFCESGVNVTFEGFVEYSPKSKAAVVRGIKITCAID